MERTIELLNAVAEFLENQSDVVDGSYGEPHPNRAMSLLRDVEWEIDRLKRLPSSTAAGMFGPACSATPRSE